MLKPPSSRRAQQGLTLVELMVGLTVGLIVLAGAVVMASTQIGEHKRLVLETQLQQDLRAAADLMLRDLKRAGTWDTPQAGVWSSGNTEPRRNPYDNVSLAEGGDRIEYHYARHTDHSDPNANKSPEDNQVTSNENFGFRISQGRLEFMLGGQYQALTDPSTVIVTQFNVRIQPQSLSLPDYCTAPCPVGVDCPPRLEVRDVSITLEGQAAHDLKVKRSVDLRARLRNDRLVGACS